MQAVSLGEAHNYSNLKTMTEPDAKLRAVELKTTVASVRHLKDNSLSVGLRSALEFTKPQAWPITLLQGEPCAVLIQPDNIDADAGTVKPKGKKGGSASQQQRFLVEAIGTANGVPPEKLEAYYQSRMNSNLQRLQQELDKAQTKQF